MLSALWLAWLLSDVSGLKFVVGVVPLALIPVVIVVTGVKFRRHRSRTVSGSVDRPH